MNKYIDLEGLRYFAERMKEYIDVKVELTQTK